jgi:hypothetical protein
MHVCTVLLPIKISLVFTFIGIVLSRGNLRDVSMCVAALLHYRQAGRVT